MRQMFMLAFTCTVLTFVGCSAGTEPTKIDTDTADAEALYGDAAMAAGQAQAEAAAAEEAENEE